MRRLDPLIIALGASALLGCGAASVAPSSPSARRAAALPADTTFFASLDVQAAQRTQTWKQGFPVLLEQMRNDGADLEELMSRLKAGCQFDALRDLEWIGLVAGADGFRDEVALMMGGHFDQEQALRCAAAMGWEVDIRGPLFEVNGDLYAGFSADGTLAMSFDEDALPFLQRLITDNGEGESGIFSDMLAVADQRAPLWMVTDLSPEESLLAALDLDEVEGVPTPEGGHLSVHLDDGIRAEASVRFGDPHTAGQIADLISGGILSELRGSPALVFLSGLRVEAAGPDVRAHFVLEMPKVETLLAIAKREIEEDKRRDQEWDREWKERQARREAEERKARDEKARREAAERERIARLDAQARRAAEQRAARERQDREQKARAHTKQGTAYLDAEVFDKAVEEFEAAYALMPLPALLYNIAFSYDNQRGGAEQALDYYNRYLSADPDGKMADVARRRVAKIVRALRRRSR
jgi:hypothetical protein